MRRQRTSGTLTRRELSAARAVIRFLSCGGLLAALACLPMEPSAMCVPFPCDDCWVVNSGQLNLVVFDREAGEIRLVPNIRFQGESPIIALVVPTPALPTLSAAPSQIWSEASQLTAPAPRTFASDGFGCTGVDAVPVSGPEILEDSGDGVVILAEQTVGGFEATIVRSDEPDALVRWLEDNGFAVDPREAQLLAPLVEDGWVFTAMKSDSSRVMPQNGWNASVDPIEFRWSGDRLEVPFGLLQINASSGMPMTFFVVDGHRSQLAEFTVSYANRITRSEQAAITERYPALASYLGSGRFLTRLDARFFFETPTSGRFAIERAPTDAEFRRGVSSAGIVPLTPQLCTPTSDPIGWLGARFGTESGESRQGPPSWLPASWLTWLLGLSLLLRLGRSLGRG